MSSDRSQVFGPGAAPPGVQVKDVMRDDFGFEVPIESVPIPSRGVVYPDSSPLHNQETIDIRAMTAREEDILTSRALIKKGTVISHLLQSCIVDKRVNVNEMLTGDRNSVMVALRITGYGSDYNVEAECPACSNKSKQTFNLSELQVKPLEIDPSSQGENSFEFRLPVTKKTVRFKFLTGLDEEEILQIQERKKKTGAIADSLVTTRLQYAVISVEGKTDKALISNFMRNMPARDSLALRTYIDKHEPGIDMKVFMECPSCSESSEIRMPMGAGFFWPGAE